MGKKKTRLMAVMFSSAVEQKAPLPPQLHWRGTRDLCSSAPAPSIQLLEPASGLFGGVSQDHPDSHTSGYPLLTDSNTWHATDVIHLVTHRFGSAIEVPGLSLLRSLCTWNWVAWVVWPTVAVDIGHWQSFCGNQKGRQKEALELWLPFTHFKRRGGEDLQEELF